jgi:hypothetical protein
MVAHLWHWIIVTVMALSLLMGCASSPYVGTGAAIGGGLGALTGAAIGHRNPWAGAAIGGLVGTAVGAAGGYMVQQRQYAPQQQQGYYYPSQPGYGAPAQPGYGAPAQPYGYRAPAPGNAAPGPAVGYNTPNPVTPQGPQYSAAPAPQPSNVRTPVTTAPYNYSQAAE